MENRVYGYARVSSKEQNENRQCSALLQFKKSTYYHLRKLYPLRCQNKF